MSSTRFQAPEWTKNSSLSPRPWRKYRIGKCRVLSPSNEEGRTTQKETGRARILLGMELHSTRPVASRGLEMQRRKMSERKWRNGRVGLLIAESVDGIELGGTRSRIEARGETHK